MPDEPRFPVRFDDEAFNEDVAHATKAAREVAEAARKRLEQDGIAVSELRQCEEEARDGTRLGGCVKTYLPQPDGPWGMVFSGDVEQERGPVLVCQAFGRRHALSTWQLSVYQVADRRLHADETEAQGP